jgi:hypothetical protein
LASEKPSSKPPRGFGRRRIACDGVIASFNKIKIKAYVPFRNVCPDNKPLFYFLFMNGTEDESRCKEDRIGATKSYKRTYVEWSQFGLTQQMGSYFCAGQKKFP